MQEYILSLDQGTSISRAIIFDRDGKIIAMSQKEFEQFSPRLSWIEQDANEIWYSQASVAEEVIHKAGLKAENIKAIGITNQRETTILWFLPFRKLQWCFPKLQWCISRLQRRFSRLQ